LPSSQIRLPRPRLRRPSWLREILDTFILVAAIFALVNLISARYIVEGSSMEPNFQDGQILYVSRLNYLLGAPERLDIVVFHYPRDPSEDYIKRIIGLPGDVVEIRNTRIYVNDVLLDEPYINEPCTPSHCRDERWELGPEDYIVLGDNRNNSSDSRVFDQVNRKFLVGEVLVRYWPPEKWGIVSQIGAAS
jgi:signal peptidase I